MFLQVNSSLLQKGYIGAYLQFPSAAELTNAYSGEYTCTASNPLLGSKQVTTLLLVFEPGQSNAIQINVVSLLKDITSPCVNNHLQ